MRPRINNPALSVPGVLDALQALSAAANHGGLPKATVDLVQLRASQINGCAVCIDIHTRSAKNRGETNERLFSVAAWREAPYFTDADRPALALTEAATRLADRADPVPDYVFREAAEHFDEPALAALVVQIAVINAWNRINVTTSQISGEWTQQQAN